MECHLCDDCARVHGVVELPVGAVRHHQLTCARPVRRQELVDLTLAHVGVVAHVHETRVALCMLVRRRHEVLDLLLREVVRLQLRHVAPEVGRVGDESEVEDAERELDGH